MPNPWVPATNSFTPTSPCKEPQVPIRIIETDFF